MKFFAQCGKIRVGLRRLKLSGRTHASNFRILEKPRKFIEIYRAADARQNGDYMINYKIEGGNLPVLICYPEAGQTVSTESGSMCWMSPNMRMETNTGGGIRKFFSKMFSGERLFLNHFTPEGTGGMVAFASSFPGSIIPFEVTPGNSLIVQKSGFLAMEAGMDLSIFFQKKFGAGLFGGEGFIMQKISGCGMAFVEIDGHAEEIELSAGESIVVSSGHLAAMTESCRMDVQTVKGFRNVFFGGEGLFLTRITGPGRVWLQSMPVHKLADELIPFLPTDRDGDSDVTISFGD